MTEAGTVKIKVEIDKADLYERFADFIYGISDALDSAAAAFHEKAKEARGPETPATFDRFRYIGWTPEPSQQTLFDYFNDIDHNFTD